MRRRGWGWVCARGLQDPDKGKIDSSLGEGEIRGSREHLEGKGKEITTAQTEGNRTPVN